MPQRPDLNDGCPYIKPNGEQCSNESSYQKKVQPFCHVAHRDEHIRQLKKLDEERLVARLAMAGELVENNGRLCRIKHQGVATVEIHNPKKPKGKRHKTGDFITVWETVCGEKPEYPKAVKAEVETCLACLAMR